MKAPTRRLSLHLPTSDVQKMVDFYHLLGFSLLGDLGIKDGVPIFACLGLGDQQLRIELWNLPSWAELKKGFSVTTLWFETDSIALTAQHLQKKEIPFHGPSVEDYGSIELELFDPEGFRIIFSEAHKQAYSNSRSR